MGLGTPVHYYVHIACICKYLTKSPHSTAWVRMQVVASVIMRLRRGTGTGTGKGDGNGNGDGIGPRAGLPAVCEYIYCPAYMERAHSSWPGRVDWT